LELRKKFENQISRVSALKKKFKEVLRVLKESTVLKKYHASLSIHIHPYCSGFEVKEGLKVTRSRRGVHEV